MPRLVLTSLPFEILSLIFSKAVTTDQTGKVIIAVDRTCNRFREITHADSNRALWARSLNILDPRSASFSADVDYRTRYYQAMAKKLQRERRQALEKKRRARRAKPLAKLFRHPVRGLIPTAIVSAVLLLASVILLPLHLDGVLALPSWGYLAPLAAAALAPAILLALYLRGAWLNSEARPSMRLLVLMEAALVCLLTFFVLLGLHLDGVLLVGSPLAPILLVPALLFAVLLAAGPITFFRARISDHVHCTALCLALGLVAVLPAIFLVLVALRLSRAAALHWAIIMIPLEILWIAVGVGATILAVRTLGELCFVAFLALLTVALAWCPFAVFLPLLACAIESPQGVVWSHIFAPLYVELGVLAIIVPLASCLIFVIVMAICGDDD